MTKTADAKIREDLGFYLWLGAILYAIHTVLNVIDFHLRFDWDPLGYLGFALYFGINLFILIKIKHLRNWARHVFIAKFILLSLMFYPQSVLLESGSWMYSAHMPHGAFQRTSNFGNFLYELFYMLFLIKKGVRLTFVRAA